MNYVVLRRVLPFGKETLYELYFAMKNELILADNFLFARLLSVPLIYLHFIVPNFVKFFKW